MTGLWIVAASAALMNPDDTAGPPPEVDPGLSQPVSSLEITFLPGVWLPRLDGKSSLGPGGSGGEIQLAHQLALDSSEPTFNVELAIRKREVWEVLLTGFGFSTDSAGRFIGDASFGSLALGDGDPFSASFDITSFSAELGIGVFRPFADGGWRAAGRDNRTWQGRYIADLRISPQFGMRYLDIEQSVTLAGDQPEVAGGEWVAVHGGLQVALDYRPEQKLPFLHMLRMQGSLAVGPALGGDGGIMWQVRGGLTLQVTEQIGVMLGYRLLEMDLENDDYTLQGGLQGLFLAASVRF